MPKSDYSDPELSYPHLQAKTFTLDDETHFLTLWLWEKPGQSRKVMDAKNVGNIDDVHQMIEKNAKKYGADIGPDDIEIGS